MKGNFFGLLLVAATVWLFFMGGLDAVLHATQGYTATGAPVVGAVQTGIQRVLATPVVQVGAVGPAQIAQAPTAAPLTPVATQVIMVPLGVPQGTQVVVVPLTPTPMPPTAVPPTETPRYPSKGMSYEVVTVHDHGYEQQCLNVPKLGKRVCDAPGLVITDYKASLYAGYLESGLVPGEPIP